MSAAEIRDYVNRLSVEQERMEEYLMDIALYSDGVISFGELVSMPMPRVKMYEKRLNEKLHRKAGKNAPQKMEPGQNNG